MTLHKNSLLAVAVALIALASLSVILFTSNVGVGNASEPNMHAAILNTATTSVGVAAASQIAADTGSRSCASRVITTYSDISLSFDSDFTPTASAGHLQSGTTTVFYDSAIYGCGNVSAIARSATSTITVSTFVF